jgi:hypothetical protein
VTIHLDSTPTSPPCGPASILDHFAELDGPRREQGRLHRLDEIVFLATWAVLCGADNRVQTAAYGRSQIAWLRTFLALPDGIPAQETPVASSARSTHWPCRSASTPGSRR